MPTEITKQKSLAQIELKSKEFWYLYIETLTKIVYKINMKKVATRFAPSPTGPLEALEPLCLIGFIQKTKMDLFI